MRGDDGEDTKSFSTTSDIEEKIAKILCSKSYESLMPKRIKVFADRLS